jgi:GMP synthase-like glutamine amidotransferase
MRLHSLQHVTFEDSANIAAWARQRGHEITRTRLYAQEPLPDLDSFDCLVVMGGLMNIYEHDTYPWLVQEKAFITQAIERKRFVLGVCLGGQLIADCLGGKVTTSPCKEIGWHSVTQTPESKASLLSVLPQAFDAFQWHGDMFSIPPGARHLAFNEACPNQAFQYEDHVLAMQFHLDYSQGSIQRMIEYCGDELVPGACIQTDPKVLINAQRTKVLEKQLFSVLDYWCQAGRVKIRG